MTIKLEVLINSDMVSCLLCTISLGRDTCERIAVDSVFSIVVGIILLLILYLNSSNFWSAVTIIIKVIGTNLLFLCQLDGI